MPPNSDGELECARDLYKVCASVAQQQAEVAAIFGCKKQCCVPLPSSSIWFCLLCFWRWNYSYNVAVSRMSMKLIITFTGNFTCCYKKSVSAILPAVSETQDLLHTCRKGLLWREQQWPVTESPQSGNFWICLYSFTFSFCLDFYHI